MERRGAIGLKLYDRVHYPPLVAKFALAADELADAQNKLVQNRRTRFTLSSFSQLIPRARGQTSDTPGRPAGRHGTAARETGTGKKCSRNVHAASNRAGFRSSPPWLRYRTIAEANSRWRPRLPGADRKGRDGKFKLADKARCSSTRSRHAAGAGQALRVQEQEVERLGQTQSKSTSGSSPRPASIQAARTGDASAPSLLPPRRPADHVPRCATVSDIEVLCDAFLDRIAARTGTPHREIAPDAIAALSVYDWPGNVRELQNALERATMLTDNVRLTADDFASILPVASIRGGVPSRPARRYADLLDEFERTTLVRALSECDGKVTLAAKELGMSRAGLYRKLASLGIKSQN